MFYRIEPMRLSDIAQVMAIEKVSYPTAWPASAYRREITQNKLARYLVCLEEAEGTPTQPEPTPRPALASPLQRLTAGLQRLVHPVERPAAATSEEAAPTNRVVVGYVGLWLMVDEVHITTIAVAPSHRGRGLGEFLLVAAFEIALELGAEFVTLEVRVGNTPAIRLYEKYTMRQVGLRKNYYTDTHEDALIMTSANLKSSAFRAVFERLRAANRARVAALAPASSG